MAITIAKSLMVVFFVFDPFVFTARGG